MDVRRKLSGLYFVVDPTMQRGLVEMLDAALRGGVDVVQVWASWRDASEGVEVVREIATVTKEHDVPLIINNDLEMARRVEADGVHLDTHELAPLDARRALGDTSMVGYTTGNDLSRVTWADERGADYISFCSVFPSPSVTDCEIVPLEVIKESRRITQMPIFASGGITLLNARAVMEAGTDGIAVVSAIQRARDPQAIAEQFKRIISSVLESRSSGASLKRSRSAQDLNLQ